MKRGSLANIASFVSTITQEILFEKLSDGDDEPRHAQLRAVTNTTWLEVAMIAVYP